MYSLYKGKQPCPGCGRTGEENPRYYKDKLCFDCSLRLKLGREMSEYYGMERSVVNLPEICTAELEYYKIRYVDDALASFLGSITSFTPDFAKRYGDDWRKCQLVKSEYTRSVRTFVIPTQSFEAAKRLCEELKRVTDELYVKERNMRDDIMAELDKERDKIFNDGVKKGRNLLFQLNNNEITLDDFFKPQHYSKGGDE